MDNMITLKRPKPGDDEEELFRMQEDFLKNRLQPSAKVINLRDQIKGQANSMQKYEANSSKVQSRFSELKKQKTEKIFTSRSTGEVLNANVKEEITANSSAEIHDLVQSIPIDPSNIILGNIIERKFDMKEQKFSFDEKVFNINSEIGFPKVFVSDNYMNTSNKRSLFSQKISKKENVAFPIKIKCQEESDATKNENSNAMKDFIEEIHQENLNKLNEMTEEEILKEKKMLKSSLNAELIKFLKNRKRDKNKTEVDKPDFQSCKLDSKECIKNKKSDSLCCDQDQDEAMECASSIETVPKPCVEILKEAKEKGWVHLDTIEPAKLQWMQDIPEKKEHKPAPDEPYNARFDFNGLLLPYKDENLSVDKGLHHHGEEPERPGYSLQELLQLSRSSTQQQRCTALTTLANILEKSRKGWYDKVLQPAPLNALSQNNVLLLLRFSLDDTSVAVVTATLQVLRAFVFSEADEICLDRMFGWDKYIEPTLKPPPSDIKDESTLKDHELVQLDAVSALLRSDILLRIRYILSEMHPPPVGVICALEILTRLARHSHIVALNIASTPNLLNTIICNFIPLSVNQLTTYDTVNNAYGIPITASIRLCRILVCYGGKVVAEKLVQLKIIHSILSYVSSEAGKEGIKINIESLRLWKLLLHHKVAMDSIEGAQLTLISQLQLLLCNHDIGKAADLACEYATVLIAVASTLNSFKENISVLLSKWSRQLSSLSSPTWCILKLISQTLLSVNNLNALETNWMSNSNIFSTLCSTSNLLSTCVPSIEREPSCLPSLGVRTEEDQLQPIISQNSCIPFLAIILDMFYRESFETGLWTIFNQPEFIKYIQKLESTSWNLERSWYTRMEFYLVTIIVKAAHFLNRNLNSIVKHNVWKISIKLVSSLPGDFSNDVVDMLRIALSNEKLNLELITDQLSQLNLNNADNQMKYEIANLYEKYVISNSDWSQAAMPKDWLYLPLVHIYTKCRNNETSTEKDKKNILVILCLEIVLPELVAKLSPTLKFSRLVLTYLCDTVYLNNDVSILLNKVMSNLMQKYYKKLDFTKDLPGLNSFVDLFTAMCEHFCSTSYGDHNFAMILLIPIAQRHNVHYRKLLWSEHAGVLRYLRLPLNKLIIPLQEYLYPLEDDMSLIETYITALVRNTVKLEWCPIPYTIALHHSAMYLKLTTKLAIRMRTKIETIPDKSLVNILLNYKPPIL
ncbi:RNA polymerase II-associated protein 1 isoform X1 [Vespa velutina]|uniref:RNA polymerase II-associated protein 1 isoform X1 n=2 Tax=Vespa velutina TaxID=202808 RepID=UPI001FB25BD4|nr:RNA polymerase II-associated protein 1 isoform X1 [Vespa velutina]